VFFVPDHGRTKPEQFAYSINAKFAPESERRGGRALARKSSRPEGDGSCRGVEWCDSRRSSITSGSSRFGSSTGFVIVSALDLGTPDWLVAVLAVAGVLVGIKLVNAVKRRRSTPQPA